MNKLILIGFLAILIIIGCTSLTNPPQEYKYCSGEHHGLSTNGTCSIDTDCVTDGCNGEICRSKSEEPIVSTCVYNPPYPKDLGCSCECVNNKCIWAK